jgi:glucose/arabinose dehydrogenase
MLRRCLLPLLLVAASGISLAQNALQPHPLHLANGKNITLSIPSGLEVKVAAEGMHRLRFLAMSPDHRIFATDMFSLEDNRQGAIFILDAWDAVTHRFSRRIPYLEHLRNPNNVAFYTDATGQAWIYTALTDRLVRYKYKAGANAPDGEPEVLANFPDYGLNYKYGGWHLTRTVAFANLHGHDQLYVTAGSSCNACREKEAIRATLSVMDPDGRNQRILATGLRNAVDLAYVASIDNGALFATNMGADHLGNQEPEDTFFELDSSLHPTPPGVNYGWPTCYFAGGVAQADPAISHPDPDAHIFPPPPAGPPPEQFDCSKVPAAYTTFAAHSSPLGLAFFDGNHEMLKDSFLVALHGAGHPKIGTGYRVVRFSTASRKPQDFITGFLSNGKVIGRPCGLIETGKDSFLLTDDVNGVVYAIYPRK